MENEKRGRGRPRKGESGYSTNTENSTENTGAGADNSERIDNIENTKVNLVEVEIPVKAESKRGRPKGSTQKEKKEKKLQGSDISPLIQTVFSLVSLKAGEHWQLSNEEVDSLSKPLCNILDKLNLTEKVSNMSDGAGLILAVIMIIAPRVMITIAQKKEKKEVTKTDEQKIREFKKNTSGSNGKSTGGNTLTYEADVGSIKAFTNATATSY
jgi:hypothetical protein